MFEKVISTIESILEEKITHIQPQGGGCIAENFLLSTENKTSYFLKTGGIKGMFLCEANGINEISLSHTIRVPRIIISTEDFLLIESIGRGNKNSEFFIRLGKLVADMHRFNQPKFGFYEDNYIGTNRQINKTSPQSATDWTTFYFENRLLYQYRLAEMKGYISSGIQSNFRKLESIIHKILDDVHEPAALLHGDLWGGNYLCDEKNEPVLIDPAVYYGHRETDLAMTKLFGGFPNSFYEAYQEHYPLADGWEYRENIYKLYHILNHLNLFGRSYLSEAESLIQFYL